MYKGESEENDAPKINADIKLSENQKKIIAAIKDKPSITQKELAVIVGISERHINNNMIELQQLRIIERDGSKKIGQWFVRSV